MHDEIAQAIKEYLQARRRLFEVAEKYPDEMRGNDNIIGRIGEYLALQFLRAKGRFPTKTESLSQKGFDLEDGNIRISVKILTTENIKGRGVRLKDPWDELLLIHLKTSDLSGKVGFITRERFLEAVAKGGRSATPVVTLSMLGPKGLFSKYGEVAEIDCFL